MICSTVNVAVRIRPLVSFELENGSESCVAVVQGKEKIQVVGSEKSYRFDHVFGPDVDNESFYNSVMRNKVAEVFNGRDVTILAYGQRSSGKTHTMGTNYTGEENTGIIPRAIDTLFNLIHSNGDHKYKVTVTFIELYNKQLYDLLASNKEGTERIVKVKKNVSKVFGLTESPVTNFNTALQCLVEGSQKRMTSEKRGNSQSTRSHAIFTITIYQRKNVDPRVTTTSKLHFVDLSGSKHGKKKGKKAKENKDLLAIRNWINHERKGKSDTYTKYQNSKLAILLRDSLRGDSMVLFIACVSPAGYCLVETLQTLQYASRLRKIKRDINTNQTNPVGNKIATNMDGNLIESKPNLVNGLEVQQSASNINAQQSVDSDANDKIKAQWILDAQNSNHCCKSEQENWLQMEIDIDRENSQRILAETFQHEVDEDWDEKLIQDALKSSEFSTIEQQTFQEETEDNIEALRIPDVEDSSKCSITEQETFKREMDDDSQADFIQDSTKSSEYSKTKQGKFQRTMGDDIEAQRSSDVQGSSKCSENHQETFQDDDSEAESIKNDQTSSESSEIKQDKFQRKPDGITEVQRNSDILKTDKSSGIKYQTFQSEMNTDSETELIQDDQKLSEYSKTKQEEFQSIPDDDTEVKKISEALESSKCNKSEQEIAQGKTNDDTNAQTIQDAVVSNKTSKSGGEIDQIQMDDESVAERIQDALESNKLSKTEQGVVQIEMDDKTTAKTIQNAPESTKSNKFENEMNRNETNTDSEAKRIQDAPEPNKFNKTEQEIFQTKMINSTNSERIQPVQNVSKFSEAQRENCSNQEVEDSPLNLFSKIADFFLEPSPTEEKELQKEIRNLRKTLRDRTAKLNTNIMDDLSLHEDVGVSKKRRENAKLVVAKILKEFQEVLTYIVENLEIRDWIVRVFRRIRDLLNEQKEIAGKMLRCEMDEDEVIDEKHAEHTMRQVDRYHELQGVNRCIALLEELVASLPKESITVRDIVRNLEDTTNQIKELENEKIDLVEVLKCAESLNDSRKLAEYGIDKVLVLDEKISRLWRRRIKQMIAIERREKFDQQISSMSAQIEILKSAKVSLVEEMKNAEKQWKRSCTSGERNPEQNRERTKKAKNSKVFRKCTCKVLECLNRRCSCVRNGVSCTDCNCNAELCQNSNKENNTSNVNNDSQALSKIPAGGDLKCACTIDCSDRRCTCRKNGAICNDDCRCRPEFCKNKNKENGTTEVNCNKPHASNGSVDGKVEVAGAANSLHENLCMCHKNGTTCTNCNCSWKLREYKAKARRRLFTDIEDSHENEGNEESRKRPRLGA